MSINPERISTIVFDIGGVLVDLHGTPFKEEWLPGANVSEGVWPFWLQSSVVRAFEQGQIDSEVFAEQFIEEAGLTVEVEAFLEHFMHWPARLFGGVPEMLKSLGKRYRLAALSNSNAFHWPMLMRDMQLAALIPDCISSHQIGVMKPDSRAFQQLIDKLGVAPEEILFLDDYQLSIETAKGLGMQAVKVTGTIGGVETIKRLGLLS
ncbi:MAG: HAD-IA family hydrolase [Gammaproteobacteria bacterium]|nr:HAD-IA family hydrolase [Gammaproteobacteria bacterium]